MQEPRKHEIVCDWLRRFIDQNKFSDEIKIPSEHVLCRKFGVSRQTVRTAIGTLCREDLLRSVRGSGTYVNKAAALSNEWRRPGAASKIAMILQGQDRNANSMLLKGAREVMGQSEVELKVFFTDNRFANERSCLEHILSQSYNGVIVDGVKASLLNPNLDCYRALKRNGIPVIFYNNYYEDLELPKVIINDRLAADSLMQRLFDAGHRHFSGILFYDNYECIQKYKCYVRALVKNGAVFHDVYVKWCISNEAHDRGYCREIARFLRRVPDCTAIICCNFMILELVQTAIQNAGKSVPQDYSLVCFDYSGQDWAQQGVTCSIHPGYEMGRTVSTQLLEMIRAQDISEAYSRIIDPEIYDGRSIAPVPLKA